jgi:hypothetical protein
MPTPAPELTALVGDTLDGVIGIADDKVVIAIGRDASKTLKQAINDSKKVTDKEVPPSQLTILAAPISQGVQVRLELEGSLLKVLGSFGLNAATMNGMPTGGTEATEPESKSTKSKDSKSSESKK